MPECDFNNITFRHGCFPAYVLHIFRTTLLGNSTGWLPVNSAAEEIELNKIHPNILACNACRGANFPSCGMK